MTDELRAAAERLCLDMFEPVGPAPAALPKPPEPKEGDK